MGFFFGFCVSDGRLSSPKRSCFTFFDALMNSHQRMLVTLFFWMSYLRDLNLIKSADVDLFRSLSQLKAEDLLS